MAEFSLQALKDEIANDASVIGLKDVDGITWKGDQVIADLLNDPTDGALIRRKSVMPVEIKQTVTEADFETLAAGEEAYFVWIVQGEIELDVRSDTIFNGLTQIFSAASDTRPALIALFQKVGSRAEVLWGDGTKIQAGQVGRAANL